MDRMKTTYEPAAGAELWTRRRYVIVFLATSLVICGSVLSFVYSENAIHQYLGLLRRHAEAVAGLTRVRLDLIVSQRVRALESDSPTRVHSGSGSLETPDPLEWVCLWKNGTLIGAAPGFEPPPHLRDAATQALGRREQKVKPDDTSRAAPDLVHLKDEPYFLVLADGTTEDDEGRYVCFISIPRFLALGWETERSDETLLWRIEAPQPPPPDAVPIPGGLERFCMIPRADVSARIRLWRLRYILLLGPVTLLAVTALVGLIWKLHGLARREAELLRLQADFVSGVSHELKTPLALIHLFAETLLEDRVPTTEKKREYYDIILRESTRLTHLINNVLDFSRLRSGERAFDRVVQDVGEAVRSVYEAYRAELDHAGMSHALNIAPNLPPAAIDRDAIGQAVLNLMSNAVKYSEDERWLQVDVTPDTRRGRHGVLISVHDRGIGIRPEDRAAVFEGFFRAPDPRVRKRRGTGLGLALVRHIVEAHGGMVSVESRLIKGTTFHIFLPSAPTT